MGAATVFSRIGPKLRQLSVDERTLPKSRPSAPRARESRNRWYVKSAPPAEAGRPTNLEMSESELSSGPVTSVGPVSLACHAAIKMALRVVII